LPGRQADRSLGPTQPGAEEGRRPARSLRSEKRPLLSPRTALLPSAPGRSAPPPGEIATSPKPHPRTLPGARPRPPGLAAPLSSDARPARRACGVPLPPRPRHAPRVICQPGGARVGSLRRGLCYGSCAARCNDKRTARWNAGGRRSKDPGTEQLASADCRIRVQQIGVPSEPSNVIGCRRVPVCQETEDRLRVLGLLRHPAASGDLRDCPTQPSFLHAPKGNPQAERPPGLSPLLHRRHWPFGTKANSPPPRKNGLTPARAPCSCTTTARVRPLLRPNGNAGGRPRRPALVSRRACALTLASAALEPSRRLPQR